MNNNQLLPSKMYNLKWATAKRDNTPHNKVVLVGEFIKYFDNTYCEQYKNFKFGDDGAIPIELVGTVLNPEGEILNYPFDHPLHPYSRFSWEKFNGCNMGLFKIISRRDEFITFKGERKNDNNTAGFVRFFNNPYNSFVTLKSNSIINTAHLDYGHTLMWADLDKVAIIPYTDKNKLLQEKAVNTYKELPDDVTRYVMKPYLGLGGKNNVSIKKTHNKKTCSKKSRTNKFVL